MPSCCPPSRFPDSTATTSEEAISAWYPSAATARARVDTAILNLIAKALYITINGSEQRITDLLHELSRRLTSSRTGHEFTCTVLREVTARSNCWRCVMR